MVNKLLRQGSSFLFKQQSNILSAAFVMMVLVLASRFLGLWRNWFLARYFGAGVSVAAFNTAFQIPDLLTNILITGALSTSFIPIFTTYVKKNDHEDAEILASTILNFSLIIFLIAGVFLFFFPIQIYNFFHIAIKETAVVQTANLTRLIILGEMLLVVGSLFTSVLQSYHRFLITALAPVLYNLGIIFGIAVLSRPLGIYGVGLGVVFGAFLHVLIQLFALNSMGFKYRLALKIKDPDVIRVLKLSLPRAIGAGVGQLEVLVNYILVTSVLTFSSVAVFEYAGDLQNLPIGLFGLTIATAALPTLSHEWADGKKDDFKRTFLASLFQLLYLAIPASIILAVLRIPVVRLTLGSNPKLFDWPTTVAVATTLSWFAVGIFAQAGFLLVTKAFYAMHDTITPLKVAAVSLVVHIVVTTYFVSVLAKGASIPVAYVGLATSISGAFNFFCLLFLLNRKVGGFSQKQILYPIIKIVVPAAVMALFLYVPLHYRFHGQIIIDYIIDTTKTLNLLFLTGLVAFLGFALYVVLTWWLRSEELTTFRKMLPDFSKITKPLNIAEPVDTSDSNPRP